MSFFCEKCNKKFKSEKILKRHLDNVLNPCDFVCRGCNYKAGSKGGFYRHKKECKKHQDMVKVVNNVTSNNNNINASQNQNVTNNNNNVNQNIVLLQPFGVEREYMQKTEVISPVRDVVIGLIKQQRFAEAYEAIFNQIHGNEKYPEYHNIYLPDIERDDIAVFKGRNFKLDSYKRKVPGLYRFLQHEMKRLVWKSDDLDSTEKDQLMHDIQCNWRSINEYNDPDMKRTLYNNRNVVFDTMDKYTVKPHSDMIISELRFRPKDLNRDHIVKLP